jgi:CRISPR-associated protein Cas2
MSFSERRAWIVAYDIACPRRLVRVHNFLRAQALVVQYSVFIGLFDARRLGLVIDCLRNRIDRDEDDVRIYPVPAYCEPIIMGARPLPRGVCLPDEQLVRFLSSPG